jgi:hypothetical protein
MWPPYNATFPPRLPWDTGGTIRPLKAGRARERPQGRDRFTPRSQCGGREFDPHPLHHTHRKPRQPAGAFSFAVSQPQASSARCWPCSACAAGDARKATVCEATAVDTHSAGFASGMACRLAGVSSTLGAMLLT